MGRGHSISRIPIPKSLLERASKRAASEPVAFPCPECGEATIVFDSRPRKGASRWRRRMCCKETCGIRFTTIESISGVDYVSLHLQVTWPQEDSSTNNT